MKSWIEQSCGGRIGKKVRRGVCVGGWVRGGEGGLKAVLRGIGGREGGREGRWGQDKQYNTVQYNTYEGK